MSVARTAADPWTKEMAKWASRGVLINGAYIQPVKREDGGKKDHPFVEYPKALYRAESAMGGPQICEFKVAQDEAEERLLTGRGFAASQEQALANVSAQETEMARLAANRAYNDRWMGQKAKAEAAAVDEASMDHLGEIPPTPIRKRRGRAPGYKVQKKAATAAAGE